MKTPETEATKDGRPSGLAVAPCSADLIFAKQREIDRLNAEINRIAKDHIPDFHFLDYKVSTDWRCEKSPIGVCLWELRSGRFTINCTCRYCGEPVERK